MKQQVKQYIPTSLFKRLVVGYHFLQALAAIIRYGHPARGMKFVGVTGTNGKTSTTVMMAAILEAAGYKVGMSTTAIVNDGQQTYENNLDGGLTNATPFTMQRLLRDMKRNGVQWVAMEAGSQGLHQFRLLGIRFQAVAITNLTNEHLDYHGTMQNYAAAKARLFRQAPGGVLVSNADDEWADYFYRQGRGIHVTYGRRSTDFTLTAIKHRSKVSVTTFTHQEQEYTLTLKVQGEFNAYNALAATAMAAGLGITMQHITEALESLDRIPGRMDSIDGGQEYRVLVVYAHTPDAIANVLRSARKITRGKLICVTGAAGERPKSRRAPVGKLANELCDYLIVTDDEPFSEDPHKIRAEIFEGITPGLADVREIPDRWDAIVAACALASKGDTIVIAGMGHQKYRSGPNGKEAWDDAQVAADILVGKSSNAMNDAWRTAVARYYNK